MTRKHGRVWAQLAKKNGKRAEFSFNQTLVFFNADDKQQMQWAMDFSKGKNKHTMKFILTQGEPEQVRKTLKVSTPIYFDQKGTLTRRLTLNHVPSVVKQAGIYWRVNEFDVSTIAVIASAQLEPLLKPPLEKGGQ